MLSIRKFTAALVAALLAIASLVFTSAPAQAAIVLNASGVTLNFDETTQTRTVIAGTTGTNMGTAAGDIVAYRGVATIGGYVIDAVVETVSVTSTTINKYDGGSAISSAPAMFQSNITTTNAGSVVYKFSFFVGNTFTTVASMTPVILQNVYINTYDLDASGGGSNQYTEFTGAQSYTLSNNTTTNVTGSGSMLQFKYNGANSSENYSASTGSYTKGRAQVKYDNLSVISIKVGNDSAGTGGLSYFALDFSVGLLWTEGSTTINTTSTQNTIANAAPTSTNDTKTVTVATAAFVTAADFGTYADPDLNPWVSVSIETLPAGGTLQWYNGTVWVNVTVGQVISFLDFDNNKLRYTSAAQTTSDSFTFKVSDGLLSSVAAYTLSLTVTGGGAQAQTAQAITFTQPANQLLSSGTLTVAPTADSGLTVTLASTTPSVCTVSGFVITFVSTGTCTITASQPGDSTYSAATDVTRSFQITLTPQVITFAQPSNDLLATASLTVAPTANSGLTVTLVSTTTGVCTVSGFVITFVTTGTCSLTASQAGNSTYSAAANVSRSFQITTASVVTPPTTLPDAPDIDPVSGKTNGTTPITLPVPVNHGSAGAACLIDPADLICKHTVTIRGKGTFTLLDNGQTVFFAVDGFYGTVVVDYRVTDGYGRFDVAPVTVEVLNPNGSTTEPPTSQNGTTKGTTPVVLTPQAPPAPGSEICLVDPTDNSCKTKVTVPGVGTWTQNTNGSVQFVAVTGFIGSNTIMQRVTRASVKKFSPYTVSVAKTRGPVTITISGFADGSPVLTTAIKAKINAFLLAHADYSFVTCIGYTEGPTVLKTDMALSKARAVNGCSYVKTGLGKKLTVQKISAGQDTIEADHKRRITITLSDS